MMHKYTVLLLLSVLPFIGQAQSLLLQELVNKKKFPEVIARADSLTPADSADYVTMSAIARLTKECWSMIKPTCIISIVCKWIRQMRMLSHPLPGWQ